MKKIREMTTVLHYLAFDNFDFTRKMRYFWIIAKNNRTCFPNFRNFGTKNKGQRLTSKVLQTRPSLKDFLLIFLSLALKAKKDQKVLCSKSL